MLCPIFHESSKELEKHEKMSHKNETVMLKTLDILSQFYVDFVNFGKDESVYFSSVFIILYKLIFL